jgi:hypothetical protein
VKKEKGETEENERTRCGKPMTCGSCPEWKGGHMASEGDECRRGDEGRVNPAEEEEGSARGVGPHIKTSRDVLEWFPPEEPERR